MECKYYSDTHYMYSQQCEMIAYSAGWVRGVSISRNRLSIRVLYLSCNNNNNNSNNNNVCLRAPSHTIHDTHINHEMANFGLFILTF